MDDATARFAEQLKRDPAMLKRLLQSPDGQTLMRMLHQGGDLKGAVQDASRGNPAQAMRMVNQFLQTPEGAALADRLQKTFSK